MDYILLGVLAVMILLLVQQNRKRKKDAETLLSSLEVGSEIILHSGIKGVITEINGDDLIVESTPKTKLRVVKQAVRGVVPTPAEGN
ncbi:MAG: preprotein translocase subunit YajC [Actinomycetota bacterium]